MRICPNEKCRHENPDDVDFCEKCKWYLRWDPTQFVPAVTPPPLEVPTPVAQPVPEPPVSPPSEPSSPGATVTLVLPVVEKPTYALMATPAASTAEVAGVVAEPIVVSLRLPNADEEGAAQLTAQTEAGGHAVVLVSVRNQGPIVDNYDLDVSGIPAAWWTVTPPTVYLVPFGAPSGKYEDEVQIRFHPPRAAEAEAREWPIEVIARSRSQSDIVGSAHATLQIAPFQQLESELRPTMASGRRKARYALMVRNRANAPIRTIVSAADAEGMCAFSFDQQTFVTEPGRRAGTHFTVRPEKQVWVGRATDRRFEVVARGVDSDAAAPPHQAVFRQRAWIPWWVPVAAPIAIGAAALALMLIPKKTEVPQLRGKQVVDARKILDGAGLKLSTEKPDEVAARVPGGRIVRTIPPVGSKVKRGKVVAIVISQPKVPKLVGKTQEDARDALEGQGLELAPEPKPVVSGKPPGTIVKQVPAAGRRLPTGRSVAVFVAVASGKKRVPNVIGLTPAEAGDAIQKAGLTMTFQPPDGVDVRKVRVYFQNPPADSLVDAKQPVSILVPSPVQAKPSAAPSLAGLGAAAAAALLQKAGVLATQVRRFDQAPPGTVVGQIPPKGSQLKPGQKVELIVSAGYPEIAYSNGRDIKLIGGFDGNSVKTVAASADLEDEPSWQPNGTLIAYRRGPSSEPDKGRIWIVDSTRPTGARPLTTGTDDRRPAFSPDGRVVAFSRRNGTDRDLCFVRVAAGPSSTRCKTDASTIVDRPTWSPDGMAILVIVQQAAEQQSELLEYTSARPSSAAPADWRSQGPITDEMHGSVKGEGILFAAWAPDGKRVAIVANWGSPNLDFFRVFLAGASQGVLSRPAPVAPAVQACFVAWRSDSAELAVTQADDCRQLYGSIVRVDPTKPAVHNAVRSAPDVRDLAWQLISLSGR